MSYSRIRALPGYTEAVQPYGYAFARAIEFVLQHECEFDAEGQVRSENVDGDNGGLTKYGIDQRSHQEIDIEQLTLPRAVAIYHKSYWEPARCAQLPQLLAIAHFDAAVNMGLGAATPLLQAALRVTTDGVLGPVTLDAAKLAGVIILADLLRARCRRYQSLATNPRMAKFEKGWLNRMDNLSRFLIA